MGQGIRIQIHTVVVTFGIELKVVISKVVFVFNDGLPEVLNGFERDLLDVQEVDVKRRSHLTLVLAEHLTHQIEKRIEVGIRGINGNDVRGTILPLETVLCQELSALGLGFGESLEIHGCHGMERIHFQFFLSGDKMSKPQQVRRAISHVARPLHS